MWSNIPDLSNIKQQAFRLGGFRFVGCDYKDYKIYALIMNFVRLVDLGILEYETARNHLINFQSNSEGPLPVSSLILASGYFEMCIGNLKRAIDLLKAIRGYPNMPEFSKELTRRRFQVLSGEVEGKVAGIRHTIHHVDERIKKGKISEGQSIYLKTNENDLQLGKYVITYKELSKWLCELNGVAVKLVRSWGAGVSKELK